MCRKWPSAVSFSCMHLCSYRYKLVYFECDLLRQCCIIISTLVSCIKMWGLSASFRLALESHVWDLFSMDGFFYFLFFCSLLWNSPSFSPSSSSQLSWCVQSSSDILWCCETSWWEDDEVHPAFLKCLFSFPSIASTVAVCTSSSACCHIKLGRCLCWYNRAIYLPPMNLAVSKQLHHIRP